MNKTFITCTLPYANSRPHIGHAFEFIIGDAIARFLRSQLGANNVHFNIGLDEHGKKIYDAAIAAEKPTQQFLDELTIEWEQFCTQFNIEYNSFYRTSNPKHYERVSKFWTDCFNRGLIYSKKYTGTYCVGCESFKVEKDLINNKCPDHSTTPLQTIEEENYFFKLSEFKSDLLFWVDNGANLVPKHKLNELRNIIIEGEDISISRKKESVPWGIPVPNDDSQVIYVWFEALCNYFIEAGYYEDDVLFTQQWANSIQIFGPDNLRFQGALFQYLLKAANIPQTKFLLCHGTILDKEGKKMSKSVGNVTDPIEQINKFGIDAVRYYALAGLQTYGDSAWNENNLVELYNKDLANNYGNLVSRVLHLINIKNVQIIGTYKYEKNDFHIFVDDLIAVKECWNNFDINGALNGLRDVLANANKYIQTKEPWKPERDDYEVTLKTLYQLLCEITKLYEPVIPNKVSEIIDCLERKEKAVIFPRIIQEKTPLN